MKKRLFLTISILCLCGCSPLKRATTTERHAESVAAGQVVEREVGHGTLDVATVTEQASDEEVVTVEREYDTSRPVDPATGTPPLRREVTQARRKVDAGRREQTSTQTADRRREVTERTVSLHRDDFAVETTERRGLTPLQKALCTVGVSAILACLAWLAAKLLKRYL